MSRAPSVTGKVRPFACEFYRSEGHWPKPKDVFEKFPGLKAKNEDAVNKCLSRVKKDLPNGPPPKILHIPKKSSIAPEDTIKTRLGEINTLLGTLVDDATNGGTVAGKSYVELSKHQQELILELERREGVESGKSGGFLSFEELQAKSKARKKQA